MSRTSSKEAQALEWYQNAAEQGLKEAQYMLGRMYEHGWVVSKDRIQAMSWYQQAAAQGFSEAQHRVAMLSGASKAEASAGGWRRKTITQFALPRLRVPRLASCPLWVTMVRGTILTILLHISVVVLEISSASVNLHPIVP